jgi:ribosome-associated heat shock protein Hsp15
MFDANSARIDKWLWAVRVFKTRSLAAEACRKGHVRISGQPAKPARPVRINEVIVVKKDQMTRTYKVLQLPANRVGAPAAKECVEDQTPPSEFEKPRDPGFIPPFRPKGAGRPTKKERRDMEGESL